MSKSDWWSIAGKIGCCGRVIPEAALHPEDPMWPSKAGLRYSYSFLLAYSHDDIQRAVEEETALLGERRWYETKDGERIERLGELVMDGEYDNLFRRYFDDACGQVTLMMPRKLIRHTVTDLKPGILEGQHIGKDRDFFLEIILPITFPVQYRGGVNALIGSFLVDYICWRWLETKLPEESQTYAARAKESEEQIKKLLNNVGSVVRRAPSWP